MPRVAPPSSQTLPAAAEIRRLLQSTATTSERVRGLLALGLHPSEIAHATQVTVSALRNWGNEQAEPRPDAAIALDDLRAAAKILLDGGMEDVRVAHWLRGWNPQLQARPFEIVATKPRDVRRAAYAQSEVAST